MTNENLRSEIAPTGALRAGINMANFLLVTGRRDDGAPQGVAPDMASAVAERLGVEVVYVPYETPGQLADDATKGVWDVGLIGAEPARAEHIAFSAAYVEIEATYLVPADSPIQAIGDVDRPGVRIAVAARSAYDLYLTRNIQHAELLRVAGLNASYDLFVNDKLDALAGLRPRLMSDVEKLPGARLLDGKFTAVQQAIGTPRDRGTAAAFLRDFVEEAKASGLVGQFIERHQVKGLSVAPPA